jgi:hypothetical protein
MSRASSPRFKNSHQSGDTFPLHDCSQTFRRGAIHHPHTRVPIIPWTSSGREQEVHDGPGQVFRARRDSIEGPELREGQARPCRDGGLGVSTLAMVNLERAAEQQIGRKERYLDPENVLPETQF